MCFGREAAQPLAYAAIGFLLTDKEGVCAPYEDGRYEHYGIELAMQGGTEMNSEEPDTNYSNIDKYLGQGGDAVAYTDAHEGMMQMGLVRTEGTLAMDNAHGHDTECVSHRHREECHHHGGGAVGVDLSVNLACIVHGAHNEPYHQYAHDHSTGIANEHAALFAKDVMDEEEEQRGCHGECQYGIHMVAHAEEIKSEEHATCDAKTGGETIDSVHHIDGIDDAHSSKNGERYGYYPRNGSDTPKSVNRVHTDARGVYHAQDDEYLDGKACLGRESHDVVHTSSIEHNAHGQNDGKQAGGSKHVGQLLCLGSEETHHGTSCKKSEYQSEEDGKTSDNGDRGLLQLACVGVVHKVLQLCYLQNLEIYPIYSKQRGCCGHACNGQIVYIHIR